MPTSSFKNPISTPARKPGPIRKSTTPLDEFHDVRDNPLFWVDVDVDVDVDLQISELDQICTRFSGPTITTTAVKGLECGNCSDGGRSLSSRRSLSRGRFRNYESEKEIDLTSGHKSKSKIRSNAYYNLREQNNKFARNSSDSSEVLKGRDTWSSRHPAPETSDDSSNTLFGSQIRHSDDVRSTSINPEAEEKTIISVSEDKKISDLKVDDVKTGGILETVRSEVRRAISDIHHDFKNAMVRKNSDIDDGCILSEITHELGNSNEVDFARDVRGEYVKELEECEERTRKLRAELAAEEYREIELNEILGDMIPDPKTPQMQKPRPLRKASAERRKISRCLEEEAMAYFDECVSISTFDDSDFSSLEDPPSTLVRFKDPSEEITTLPGVSSRVGAPPFESQDISRQSSPIPYDACSSLSAKNTCNDDLHTTSSNRKKIHFSFSSKSSDITSFKQDVRSYIDNFSKDRKGRDGDEFQTGRLVHQNTSDFAPSSDLEKFLIHRMNYRSRIESGGMLLCGAYFGCPGIPLSSTLW